MYICTLLTQLLTQLYYILSSTKNKNYFINSTFNTTIELPETHFLSLNSESTPSKVLSHSFLVKSKTSKEKYLAKHSKFD